MSDQEITVRDFAIVERPDGRLSLVVYPYGVNDILYLIPDKRNTWEKLLRDLKKESQPQHFVKEPFGGPLTMKTTRDRDMGTVWHGDPDVVANLTNHGLAVDTTEY